MVVSSGQVKLDPAPRFFLLVAHGQVQPAIDHIEQQTLT
jgi:hypothetical protein